MISLTHKLFLTPTHAQTLEENYSLALRVQERETGVATETKEVMTSTKSVCARETERDKMWHSVNRSFGGLSDSLFVWDDEDISI